MGDYRDSIPSILGEILVSDIRENSPSHEINKESVLFS